MMLNVQRYNESGLTKQEFLRDGFFRETQEMVQYRLSEGDEYPD